MRFVALLLFLALALGSPVLGGCVCYIAKCGPGNCSGCCDSADNCKAGNLDTECGGSGAACEACAQSGEVCSTTSSCVSPFPGAYVSSGTVTQTPDTGNAYVNQWQDTANVAFGPASLSLLIDMPSGTTGSCSIGANITSNSTFTLQSAACSTWTDSYGCTQTWTYTGGSGTLSGNMLSVTASGTYTQTNCPGGLVGVNGTLSAQYTGSR